MTVAWWAGWKAVCWVALLVKMMAGLLAASSASMRAGLMVDQKAEKWADPKDLL